MNVWSDYRIWAAIVVDFILNDSPRDSISWHKVRIRSGHCERICEARKTQKSIEARTIATTLRSVSFSPQRLSIGGDGGLIL